MLFQKHPAEGRTPVSRLATRSYVNQYPEGVKRNSVLLKRFPTLYPRLPRRRSTVYQDVAGIWTIGFGSCFDLRESRIGPDYPDITEEEGEVYLGEKYDTLKVQLKNLSKQKWQITCMEWSGRSPTIVEQQHFSVPPSDKIYKSGPLRRCC